MTKGKWALAMALAVGGCATPGMQPARLVVTLTGLQEVPGPGDADGTGTAEIRVNPRSGEVCWNLYARQIEAATGSHIHRGAAGVAGPPVVTLTTPDAAGRSQGCQIVDLPLAGQIATRGYDFYVNVHDAPHPAGAIRGQLQGGGISRERQRRAGEPAR